jgi:hypothetical protein
MHFKDNLIVEKLQEPIWSGAVIGDTSEVHNISVDSWYRAEWPSHLLRKWFSEICPQVIRDMQFHGSWKLDLHSPQVYNMPIFEITDGVKCSPKNMNLNFVLIPFMCKNKRTYTDHFIMICTEHKFRQVCTVILSFKVSHHHSFVVLNKQPANIMRQSFPWEHYYCWETRIASSLSKAGRRVPSWDNTIQSTTYNLLLKILSILYSHIRLTISSASFIFLEDYRQNSVCIYNFIRACYMTLVSHTSCFHSTNNTRQRIQLLVLTSCISIEVHWRVGRTYCDE